LLVRPFGIRRRGWGPPEGWLLPGWLGRLLETAAGLAVWGGAVGFSVDGSAGHGVGIGSCVSW
jgi:hypothetical protein